MTEFTSTSLPAAVAALFRLNHYDITGPFRIHGAEVDLMARSLASPFNPPVYIEVTIEYVDNAKYGKDLTKLVMIREQEPDAQILIVSSKGFSLPVRERAEKTRIQTLTYEELFGKFERFDEYLTATTVDTHIANELIRLNEIYEEPYFSDEVGHDKAIDYLREWRDSTATRKRWLVVVGEYGTGKTALTKILQYRWLLQYKADPTLPLPFRIELRDFIRQFDARGLLHHFLDKNKLSHISVDFVESLIRQGKIILLLDGYDEMAQFLHSRERRTCLEALAELSADGAKGILTSRPNYFTEAEELQVFEILYSSLQANKYLLFKNDRDLLKHEKRVDQLLEQFLDRNERRLEDLTPEQTSSLIDRALAHDEEGRRVVQSILRRVFRSVESGDAVSLSGKPVILTYLLEVVEGLKQDAGEKQDDAVLSEWEVYRLIVDQLMLRDLRRSPSMPPDQRRNFLHRLSIALSQAESPSVSEDQFRDLVNKNFSKELRRYAGSQRTDELEKLFSDLRSSATLTRSDGSDRHAYRFSHNSLREFLATEFLLEQLSNKNAIPESVTISDAMRLFVASKPVAELRELVQCLREIWPHRLSTPHVGQQLCLIWDGLSKLHPAALDPVGEALRDVLGKPIPLNGVELTRLTFSKKHQAADLRDLQASGSTLIDVDFTSADLRGADFTNAVLEGVNFNGADLRGCKFRGGLLIDVSLCGSSVGGADYVGVSADSLSVFVDSDIAPGSRMALSGVDAVGYLSFNGAITDAVSRTAIARNHPKYAIVEKILLKLCEHSQRQRRGLAQRGAARQDTRYARKFVRHLEVVGIIRTPNSRKDIVEVTDVGRNHLARFMEGGELPAVIVDYLLG